MAVENVNSKPIAASAAIADFILASIGGKVRRVPISTLAETLTDAEVELISAAASALVSAAGRACYIGENENWYVWDGAQGAFIDSGYPSRGTQGNPGVIFTPHVTAAGILSWTNDGGLPNPEPVSLLGPAGGVTSFNNRSGAVVPKNGDYTAEMVGAEEKDAVKNHNESEAAHKALFDAKLNTDGDGGTLKPTFTQSATRTQLESGLEMKVLLGRIMKWLADLGTAAFKDSSNFESKGAGSSAVTAHNTAAQAHADLFAKKAGKGIAFTLTLSVAGWSNLAQTLEDARFLDAEYAYIVTPTADSLTAWGDAGIRVGDVTENGKMPFTCTDTPASAITVNIYRAEVAQ